MSRESRWNTGAFVSRCLEATLLAAMIVLCARSCHGQDVTPDATNPRVYNLRSFGASASLADNSPAVQRAVDYLLTLPKSDAATGAKGFVLKFDEMFPCVGPVFWDVDNLHGVGVGRNVSGLSFNGTVGIIQGIRRRPNGVDAPADLGVDSFGKLDTSAANAPGQRFGFNTVVSDDDGPTSRNGASWIGSSFSMGRGDGFASTRVLVVEYAMEMTAWPAQLRVGDPASARSRVMGSRGIHYNESLPWEVVVDGSPVGMHCLPFQTSDAKGHQVGVPFSQDPANPPAAMQRVCFQINLDTGQVDTFLNRVAVVPATRNMDAGWNAGVGFKPNEWAAFNIGGGWTVTAGTGEQPFRGVIHAMALSDKPVYKSVQPGEAQQRIDGYPANDQNSYFWENSPGRLATLRTHKYRGGMIVPSSNGEGSSLADGIGVALTVSPKRSGPYGTPWTVGGNVFRDMSVRLRTGSRGAAALMMSSLDSGATDCTFTGGAYGLASVPFGTNAYPLVFTRTAFSGSQAGYFGFGHSTWIRDCPVTAAGRYQYLFCGSNAFIQGGFWPQSGSANLKAVVRSLPGSGAQYLSVKDVVWDQEGNPGGLDGAIVVTAGMPQVNVSLDQFHAWQGGGPVLVLDSDARGSNGVVEVRNCQVDANVPAVVRVRDPRKVGSVSWRGAVHVPKSAVPKSGKVVEYLDGTDAASMIVQDIYPEPAPRTDPIPVTPGPP